MASRTGSIHVATTRRVYKDKTYETHLLRRSYREDGKVKNETVGNISHLPPHLIELLRRGLRGEQIIAQGDVEISASKAHGAVALVLGVLRAVGLERMLGPSCPERDRVVAMVVARLLFPSSKFANTRWWPTTTLMEDLHLGEVGPDELYAALDWLVARQSDVEKRLVHGRLCGGALVLYDVSSSYVTGRKCSLAKRGYSRDHRRDLPQVVYGVLTDAEGCPVAVEVFEGNVRDCRTVLDQVDRLRERFGLKRLVIVGDRGMITEVQVDEIRRRPGVDWITALTSDQLALLASEGKVQTGLFDARNLAEIDSPSFPGERLVVCRNPDLAALRARTREALLARTEARLQAIEKAVRTGRLKDAGKIGERVGRAWRNDKMRKHFIVEIGPAEFTWRRDEASIQAESALDGMYVVRTSLPADVEHPAERIVRDYKRLAKVERVFRAMKSTELLVRPIFHRAADRVRAHVFLCVLAAHVRWHLEQRLAALLFVDPTRDIQNPDPVAQRVPGPDGRRKRATRAAEDGTPLHSLKTLFADMATLTRNTLRTKQQPEVTWTQLAVPTNAQRRVLTLAGVPL
jgi:hypothetical protein